MRRLAVLAVFVIVARTGHANEDELEDADPPEPRVTSVVGRLHGTTAIFTVRYLVSFTATDDNRVTLETGGALATRATIHAGAVSHVLGLMRAEAAEAAFAAVTERPAGPARRWAASLTAESSELELSLAAPRAGTLTLELELHAPTCFYRDVRYAEIPESWRPALSPSLAARRGKPAEIAKACRDEDDSADDRWVGFPSRTLARRPPGADRVGASAGRAVLGDMHVARVELDVAGTLGEVPADLATVILVDASRSMTADELETQRELVLAYVEQARNTRIQVIAYARRTRALLPGWTAAPHALARLDRELRALTSRNGSDLAAGLTEAAGWLARIEGTRRVVMISDERLADRFSNEVDQLAKVLPAGTLVHTVALDPHGADPARDDDTQLAPIARATQGMSIRSGLPADHPLDATLLVRPITLDRVEVKAPGWTQLGDQDIPSCGESIAEGRACTWWGTGAAIAGPIAIEAFMWGTRVVRVVRPDPSFHAHVVRELSTFTGLEAELAGDAAVEARAVNAVWSLYAEWGGRNGYPEDTSFSDSSTCGCLGARMGSFSGSHSMGIGVKLPPLELHAQLARVVGACDLGTHEAVAQIETTRSEIVDVAVKILGATSPAREQALATCVAEAIWDATIVVPENVSHRVTAVTFRGTP